MPKVNPETGEMMSDDPDLESDDLRGGREGGDVPGANPTGSEGTTQQPASPDPDEQPKKPYGRSGGTGDPDF
jgi:hypothetical protein